MSEPTTYRFGPRPRRGVAVGLAPGQLLALGAGMTLGTVLVLGGGLVLGAIVLGLSGVWSFVPLGGRRLHAWVAPVSAQLRQPRGARAPLVLRSFGTGTRPLVPVRPKAATCRHLPGLEGLQVTDVDSPAGSVGMVTGAGPTSFTLAVTSRRFALEDEHVQAAVVGSWGQVLSACAAGRIRRLQMTERAVPESGAPQLRWLAEARSQSDPELLASYRAHVEACTGGALRHTVYLTAALPGRVGAETAAEECAALVELLHSAGFEARPLEARTLERLLASMLHASDPERTPLTWERRWDLVRTEGGSHACFEVTELPRVPVRADWTWPLLQAAPPDTARRWALHIELAPPAAGLRRAQRAVLSHDSDEALRAKWGFRSGARTLHEADSARSREQELASGFADARFALVLCVSAPDPEALAGAARSAEAQAAACGVELRRLYGQQADALAATLPLARLHLAGGWS